jgi:flagellin-like protein
MKANQKYIDNKEAVSAVIGVILMFAITVAIAATVYVYVSGLGSTPSELEAAAVATAQGTEDQIKLILAHGGEHYGDGYNMSQDVTVYINGTKATLSSGLWVTGGQLFIGWNVDHWEQGVTFTCEEGHYDVTVAIRGNVVFDGTVTVG